MAPVQEVATRAVQPFRDAWGWATSLKDARDRAASLQTELDKLRAKDDDNLVRDQRLAQLEEAPGRGDGGRGRLRAGHRPRHHALGVPTGTARAA